MKIVKIEGLSKSFLSGGIETRVLHNVSFSVEEGSFTSIMGPSGSGKSTLMNILGCLDRDWTGSYWLNGSDASMFSPDQAAMIRGREIGFVFQSFCLIPKLTAVENVEIRLMYLGIPRRERTEIAVDMLKKVGLGHRLTHRPGQLSGGQCQRVAIARAMAAKPGLILADEPTGNLDSRTGAEILELFQQVNEEGTTIILITHDGAIAKAADRTIHIADGQITGEEHNGTDRIHGHGGQAV